MKSLQSHVMLIFLIGFIPLGILAGCHNPGRETNTAPIILSNTPIIALTQSSMTPSEIPSIQKVTVTASLSATPTFQATLVPTETLTPVMEKPQTGALAFSNQAKKVGMKKDGIYIIRYPGDTPINITTQMNNTATIRHPSWSPDGKWIVFSADDLSYGVIGKEDLYIVGSDGTGLRRLTYGGYSLDPTWSPDGQWIAYVANYSIYLIHPDGSGIEALISDKGVNGLPERSPDGQYLAYCHDDNPFSDNFTNDLRIIEIKTKRTYTLVKGVQDRDFYGRISWSINSQMVYFRKAGDCAHLYRVENKEGANYERVNYPDGNLLSMAWSPDGKWMSYILYDVEDNCMNVGTQLFTAPVDESYSVRLVDQLDYSPVQPAWSPVPDLLIGATYTITELGDNLKVRDTPTLKGTELKKLKQGDIVTILEGPAQADDYYWWKMKTVDGTTGWAVDVFGWYQKQQP